MNQIEAEFNNFSQNVSKEEFKNNAIAYVTKYLTLNLKKNNISRDKLSRLFDKTIRLANEFAITLQINILRLFFLTIVFGDLFCDNRKFIYIEAELNYYQNGESNRVQSAFDLLISENYLDQNIKEDRELYTLLVLKIHPPETPFNYVEARKKAMAELQRRGENK